MRRLRLNAFRRGASGVTATAKVALFVGVVMTLLVSAVIYTQARSNAHDVAAVQASDVADALRQRIGLAHAYLRATAGRLRGSDVPTQEQFATFATSLGPQPVVDALVWLPVVTAPDRARFERLFLGGEGATISGLRAGGERVSAGSRPVYQPIAYFTGSEHLGFLRGVDFLGDERLRAGAALATATGATALTPLIDAAGRSFVVLLLPVEPGRQSETGQAPLVGAVLEMRTLLAGGRVQRAMPATVRITDVTDGDAPRLVWAAGMGEDEADEVLTAELPVGGRVWEVAVPISYADAYESAAMALVAGLILSGLIGLFADRGHHLLVADDLQREVDRQTAALQRSTAEFRALFEEGGAGKCELVPGSGHFRRVNLRLCEMLGYERTELEHMSFRTVIVGNTSTADEQALEELLRGEKDSYFSEGRFRTKGGEELWGELSATVLRDSVGRPVWIVAVVQDVTARRQAEEARQLLVRELAHRVKNTLQLARSLADQTARYAADLPSFMVLYQSRLRALATAHDQLFKTSWAGADLSDLVGATLGPYAAEADGRIAVDVPSQRLSSAETQTVALLVNELATNASKYGALSNDVGRIAIRAHVEPAGDEATDPLERLVFEWEEDAGQDVVKPSRRGFGMTFLTRAVAHQHDGEAQIDWGRRGVTYRFIIPLHPVAHEETDEAA